MKKLFRKDFENQIPYKVEEVKPYNLGDNENRLIDWSHLADELSHVFKTYDYAFYGDSKYSELRQAVANSLGINPQQVLQGVGSDQMIQMVVETFLDPGQVLLTVSPDFFMYQAFSMAHGSKFKEFPLDKNFQLDPVAFLAYAKEVNAKVIILSQPNNPLSMAHNPAVIEEIIRNFDGFVVIDEAYNDYADLESLVTRVDEFDNLIVLRTLSKSYGLAGLRVGFAISNAQLIYEMDKVLPPYNMSDLVAKIASHVINEHSGKVQELAEETKVIRNDFMEFLNEVGCQVLPSQTNFVTFRAPFTKQLWETAQTRGFNFKYYSEGPLAAYCRVGIGRPEEMALLKEIIFELVEFQ